MYGQPPSSLTQFSAFASGGAPAPSNILPVVPSAPIESLFGDFPPEPQSYLEGINSESSAEDDTLGTEPNSNDQPTHFFGIDLNRDSDSNAIAYPRGLSIDPNQPTNHMHGQDDSASGSSVSTSGNNPHSMISLNMATGGSYAHLHPSIGHHAGTDVNSRAGLPSRSSLSQPHAGNMTDQDGLPTPSSRAKRQASSPEPYGGPRLAPPSPLPPTPSTVASLSSTSNNSNTVGTQSSQLATTITTTLSTTPTVSSTSSSSSLSRRRSSASNRMDTNPSSPASTTSGTPNGEGYYYRNRDKTNYNLAHRGSGLPSPPTTPDSQKRIRCTWNLEETRMLYALLKDTTVDDFPDAQQIRAYLLREDPNCNKTLEHVRNKKANLIQKSHAKNISVGEVLIADMHKLESEAGSGSASSRTDRSHRPNTPGYAMTTSGGGTTGSDIGSPASSIGSISKTSSITSSGSTPTVVTVSRNQVPAKGSSVVRPSRRRGSKRGPSTYLTTMAQAPTATAQQLAKVAATSSIGGAAATGASQPVTTATITITSPTIAPDLSYDASHANVSPMGHVTSSPKGVSPNTSLTPPQMPSSFLNHNIANNHQHQNQNTFYTPTTEMQRWQKWVYDEMSKLFASENEVRTHLRLSPLTLSPPPTATLNSTTLSPGAQRIPSNGEQWISWNAPVKSESVESESESSEDQSNNNSLLGQSTSNGGTPSATSW